MGPRTRFDPRDQEAVGGSAELPMEIWENDAEALLRVLERAEKLIKESNERHWRVTRYYIAIGLAFGFLMLSLGVGRAYIASDAVSLQTGLMGIVAALLACVVALFRVKQDRFEVRKNKRLAGRAVEFVREYAAHTRADRSPVEEIELQLRLEQLEIESLDRPLLG